MNAEQPNSDSLHLAGNREPAATVSEAVLQAALAAGMHVDCGVWTGRTVEVHAFVDAVSRIALRDEFAAKAMQGLCANSGGPFQQNNRTGWGLVNCNVADIAIDAYALADAMLHARKAA